MFTIMAVGFPFSVPKAEPDIETVMHRIECQALAPLYREGLIGQIKAGLPAAGRAVDEGTVLERHAAAEIQPYPLCQSHATPVRAGRQGEADMLAARNRTAGEIETERVNRLDRKSVV